jgi:branched-chain amino acid transport system substrate-binding protein
MFNIYRFILVGLGLALTAGSAFAADTIKIAFINGLSGTFAIQGEEQLKAFRAAADLVNGKGGVLGRDIEIVPFVSPEFRQGRPAWGQT